MSDLESDDRIRWVADMPDSYVAGVFRWLRDHRMKYKLVDNARTLWLASGDEVKDGDWLVAEGDGVAVLRSVEEGE